MGNLQYLDNAAIFGMNSQNGGSFPNLSFSCDLGVLALIMGVLL